MSADGERTAEASQLNKAIVGRDGAGPSFDASEVNSGKRH